jgi:hypothetical protein
VRNARRAHRTVGHAAIEDGEAHTVAAKRAAQSAASRLKTGRCRCRARGAVVPMRSRGRRRRTARKHCGVCARGESSRLCSHSSHATARRARRAFPMAAVHVLDYGAGNVRSIRCVAGRPQGCSRLGRNPIITAPPTRVQQRD